MTIPAYPLQWPAGWKRTEAHHRTRARFGKQRTVRSSHTDYSYKQRSEVTIAQATSRVLEELRRMGVDPDGLVISMDLLLRLDGLPRSGQRDPNDPGVAVYWVDRYDSARPPRCMAIDRYDRIADNLAAVAATLDAMRAIERHGGAEILDRAFTGFVALPAPGGMDWRLVLGEDNPEHMYRVLRSRHHPDRNGDADKFREVQAAWDAYQLDASARQEG